MEKKPLTEKEIAIFENALKLWCGLAMFAEIPRLLSLQEAVAYAKATNQLYAYRTGKPFFTRGEEALNDEMALEAAIADVIHIMEDKRVAYLDLCDQIAFGIGKNGRPLYEEDKLKDCDFEGWEAASWSYKIYNLKDAHSLDGDDILRIIGWARHN